MTRFRLLAVSFAAAAAVAAPAACSTEGARHHVPAGEPQPSPPAPAEQDRTWLKAAHQSNLAEINAGEIAQHNGTTPEIRALGTMLVQDHRMVDGRLKPVAARLGVELPREPTAEQAHMADELKKGSGRMFNIHWLGDMTKSHEKAIAATNAEISKGSAPEARKLAKNALPVLEKHLARIKLAKDA